MTEMKTIDHIAIVVNNIKESVAYYVVEHQARILYMDKTWGLLQFKNVNLAALNPTIPNAATTKVIFLELGKLLHSSESFSNRSFID